MKIIIEMEVTPDGPIPTQSELLEAFQSAGLNTNCGYIGSEGYNQGDRWGLVVDSIYYRIES